MSLTRVAQGALKSGHLSEGYVMLYRHPLIILVFLDDGCGSKSSSSAAIHDHSLSDECGRHVIKVHLSLQIPFPYRSMALSIRVAATVTSDDILSFIKAYQIILYLFLIPSTIIGYDTRVFFLWIELFPFLTSCQSARLTKRYVIRWQFYDSLVTIHTGRLNTFG